MKCCYFINLQCQIQVRRIYKGGFSMRKFIFKLLSITLMFSMALVLTGCVDNKEDDEDEQADLKPVIYLYPEETKEVKVGLDYKGELICTYPTYDGDWNVTAHSDGTLIDKKDGNEYSYLFWEGNSDVEYDMSKGFVVKGEDTATFLREKLEYLGMIPKEYNEFIVFWLPKMQNNAYNLITFQDEVYTNNAKLEITPEPDSILRVFMAYKPLEEPISIEEQTLEAFQRQGFTVIEWGGTKIID